MEVISGEKIVKSYGKFKVLKGINLNVQDGEFVGIMGKSGSGKTTLLKILGLIESVTDGALLYKKDEISKLSDKELAICRALINDPEIIFADEPTGNLDSKSGKIVIDALKDINEHMGKTIIMVTHDPQMASYCSRLILLKDGVILEDLEKNRNQESFYQEILGKMKEL